MSAGEFDYPYEASDEASENELLDRSLSVWRGWSSIEVEEEFVPIPVDLHTASSIGQYDSVRSIIQRGEVDLNRKNKGGWTALMYACYIGHDNIVNLLLDADVNVNVKNNKGQTPLMLAACCGNESVAYFLLQAGAELEGQDKKGWTAIFHATYSGHQNMVKFLLDNNANMEAVEPSKEYTPFMEAAGEGHEIIVQNFLQHGVNVNAKACNGETARSLALSRGHMKIVSLIDNHNLGLVQALRSDPRLGLEGDLSSSDETFQRPRHPSPRGPKAKNRVNPSIRDGPDAFDRMVDKNRHQSNPKSSQYSDSFVPKGYVTFRNEGMVEGGDNEIRLRDVTSPINPEDHKLDSSGGKESANDPDDYRDAFSQTGALTIKSSSSSSGGLAAVLGISRENSVDSSEDQAFDHHPDNASYARQQEHGDIYDQAGSKSKASHGRGGKMLKPDNRRSDKPKKGTDIPMPKADKYQIQENKSSNCVQQNTSVQENKRPGGQRNCDFNPPGKGVGGRLSAKAQAEQQEVLKHLPHDLAAFLDELGLSKYLSLFEQQDVDLPVFLSLTDNDLKEVGIDKLGPRRKMTNAIARWHSKACPTGNSLEQAYCDKLEAEMQEMAIQLQLVNDQSEKLRAQVLQERELRSVTEGCLMEDRQAWQHVHHISSDLRHRCGDMHQLLHNIRQHQEELTNRLDLGLAFGPRSEQGPNSLVTAIQEGMRLDNHSAEATNEISRLSNQQLLHRIQKWTEELNLTVTMATNSVDKLLGREVQEYPGTGQGYT